LNGLEQVCVAGEKLTVVAVKDAFGIDQADVLTEYFSAIAAGDLDKQIACLESWHEEPSRKAEWITVFLLSLYYNSVLGKRIVIDPIVDATVDEQQGIAALLFERLQLSEQNRKVEFCEGLLEFWSRHRRLDESAALLAIALFQSMVNSGDVRAPRRLRRVVGGSSNSTVYVGERISLSACGSAKSNSEFVTSEDVQDIVNRSSIFMQQYGVPFNFALEVHVAFEVVEKAAVQAIKEFSQAVSARLQGDLDCSDPPFASITLLERGEDVGVYGLMVGYSATLNDKVAADDLNIFLSEYRSNNELKAAARSRPKSPSKKAAIRWHWNETIRLCASLYESEDGETEQGNRGILKKLGLSLKERRPARPVSPPRLIFSGALADDALKAACDLNMVFLSAFDDGAFERLKDGWELDEHKERVRTINERRQRIAAVSAAFAGNESGKEAIAELRRRWSLDPRHRSRTWKTWW
jgi:lysozyme family protein